MGPSCAGAGVPCSGVHSTALGIAACLVIKVLTTPSQNLSYCALYPLLPDQTEDKNRLLPSSLILLQLNAFLCTALCFSALLIFVSLFLSLSFFSAALKAVDVGLTPAFYSVGYYPLQERCPELGAGVLWHYPMAVGVSRAVVCISRRLSAFSVLSLERDNIKPSRAPQQLMSGCLRAAGLRAPFGCGLWRAPGGWPRLGQTGAVRPRGRDRCPAAIGPVMLEGTAHLGPAPPGDSRAREPEGCISRWGEDTGEMIPRPLPSGRRQTRRSLQKVYFLATRNSRLPGPTGHGPRVGRSGPPRSGVPVGGAAVVSAARRSGSARARGEQRRTAAVSAGGWRGAARGRGGGRRGGADRGAPELRGAEELLPGAGPGRRCGPARRPPR